MPISINDFNSLIQKNDFRIKKKHTNISNSYNLPELENDSFEKTQGTKRLVITHYAEKCKSKSQIEVTQNPKEKGTVYKKIFNKETGKTEKIPFEVAIAKSNKDWKVSYHFLDPKTQEELGFVVIDDWRLAKNNPIYKFLVENSRLIDDFPEFGISGDRVSIDFLQNNKEDMYCGLGNLADQIAIEYCLKENITPNIVSVADLNSHAAHYKRGRRFFPLDKNDPDIDYYEFKAAFGTTDPNEIVKKRIESTPKGQKVNTEDLVGLYMYMPQEIIKKYLEKIKESPILIW